MIRQIIVFVRSCLDCQTRKKPKQLPSGFLKSIFVKESFERVGLDFVGSIPTSKLGNKQIFIAVDYLTKWVVTKPVSNADSRHVVDFFLKQIVLQHGAPVAVISDCGRCLNSEFTRDLFSALQTNHFVTTVYHPQCNG